MNRKITGVLVGGGVGFVLAWLFWAFKVRRRVDVHLTLKGEPGGGVTFEPLGNEEYVTLRKTHGDTIHWIIENPQSTGYDDEVEVTVAGFSSDDGGDTPPVQFDNGNSRTVKRGHRPKQMPARINPNAPPLKKGDPPVDYKYNVYVNGGLVLDPIVKLVL